MQLFWDFFLVFSTFIIKAIKKMTKNGQGAASGPCPVQFGSSQENFSPVWWGWLVFTTLWSNFAMVIFDCKYHVEHQTLIFNVKKIMLDLQILCSKSIFDTARQNLTITHYIHTLYFLQPHVTGLNASAVKQLNDNVSSLVQLSLVAGFEQSTYSMEIFRPLQCSGHMGKLSLAQTWIWHKMYLQMRLMFLNDRHLPARHFPSWLQQNGGQDFRASIEKLNQEVPK